MNITSRSDHESQIGADVVYTSFKWSLNNWSLLYDHYNKGIVSPKIKLAQSEECTYQLTFQLNYSHNNRTSHSTLSVQMFNIFTFHSMQASVSYVDRNMKKLVTYKSSRANSIDVPLSIYLHDDVTETSVAQYLQDDSLILFFELYVAKAINHSPVSTNSYCSNVNTIARDNLAEMFEANVFCDVTFLVQEQKLFAHKVILAAYSDVFQAMFTTEMKEQKEDQVDIKDFDAKIFKIFLRYMYTEKVVNIDEVVIELVIVATKYEVIGLIKLCETYMMTHLTVANAIQYLLIAEQLFCSSLKEKAIQFMKQNTQILADPTNYKLLFEYPNLITEILG